MFIEKNGYVVMDKIEMRFVNEDMDFSENVEEAYIFESREHAIQVVKEFEDEFNKANPNCKYEIVNFHQTISLDRLFLDRREEPINE